LEIESSLKEKVISIKRVKLQGINDNSEKFNKKIPKTFDLSNVDNVNIFGESNHNGDITFRQQNRLNSKY